MTTTKTFSQFPGSSQSSYSIYQPTLLKQFQQDYLNKSVEIKVLTSTILVRATDFTSLALNSFALFFSYAIARDSNSQINLKETLANSCPALLAVCAELFFN